MPGVFVFRSEGSLLYFNVENVRDRFFELLAQRKDPVRLAVYYLGTVPQVDLSGAELLAELRAALQKRGIELKLAEARSSVCDTLESADFSGHSGFVTANRTVVDLIAESQIDPVIAP